MHNSDYTITTDYIGGYQYETKPVDNGGLGHPQLLFFPTTEGYIKAIYKMDPSETAPRGYQYVYIYKDHLGNNRLSYTLDPETEQVKILEENHYYPFGLRHNAYVPTKKDIKYQELAIDEKEIKQVQPAEVVYKYKYNSKELQEELGLNWYDYGARNYDMALGRWFSLDPLAIVYNEYSPYNYTLNNPIYFKDPDGRLVIAGDEETRKAIIEYLTDQLGENNGFYFNKKGILKYKKRALRKARKGYNDEQNQIVDGLTEVVDDKDKVIEVHTNDNSDEFTVDIYEPGFVKDDKGRFVMDENGIPKREGWQKTGLVADLNTENTGGALFWAIGKLDNTNQAYAHIVINRKTASTIQIKGVGGKLTTPSESSVFIHEILDHGLDLIKNGNVNKSSGPGVENVKYHNLALKNISEGKSPLRNSHYDKN